MASVSPLATFYYQTLGLQRNINQNQNLLDRTIERLNTGLRVNRAADDPFGITQAKRVQTQQISNRQASSNTAQAINLFATAETGAKGIQNNLNRMRELILQSLNDTATDSDRTQIQKEIDKLVQDTDQIARSTLFNTRQLLDGSLGNFRLTQNANSVLSQNKTLTDSAGNSLSFLTDTPTVSNQIENYDLVQFQLFDNGSGGYGLNVSTASGGVVLSYNDVLSAPTSLNVPVGGSTVNFDRAAYVNTPIYSREALTNTELNDTLDNLVSAGRLSPVSFGSLNLNVGSQSFGSFYNVTGSSSIQSLLDSVNSLSPGLSANYNTSTGLISVNYSEQVTETTSLITPYISAGTTTGVGGPYNSFGLLPSAPQGPAYRDPTAFLPATGFNLNSPPSGFPGLPGSLNTALSFSGSDSSFLNVFGLSDSSNNGLITGYTPRFYGEALATGNPGEYVNRTQVSIQNVSASQDLSGSNTGLTAGDLNTTFEVLNTAIVSSSTFAAGNFTVDFGSNGIFDYQSATGTAFDPNTNSIQDILTELMDFKPGSVSATFNAAAGELTLSNTPDPAVVNAKVTDPGLSSGLFSIDFGSNGTFNHTLTLGSSTLPDLLTALNSFNPNVSASFDANSDTLSLSNTVSPAYNTQITNPGLTVGGSLDVNYGSNGSRSIVLSNATTIQDVVSALSATGVTVSYDENADTLNFTNTANGPSSTTDTKVANPPLQAGTFEIDFGNGRVYSYAFDPSSTTIQSFQNNLNAWGASNGVTSGYDSNTDQFTISNTPQNTTSTTDIGYKLNDNGIGNSQLQINFGDNGTFTSSQALRNYTLQGIVNEINGFKPGFVSASFDESTDQISLTNIAPNDIPGSAAQIADTGFQESGFAINILLELDNISGPSELLQSFSYGGNLKDTGFITVADTFAGPLPANPLYLGSPQGYLSTTFTADDRLQFEFGLNEDGSGFGYTLADSLTGIRFEAVDANGQALLDAFGIIEWLHLL